MSGRGRSPRRRPARDRRAPRPDPVAPPESGALSLSELLGEVWMPAGGDRSIPRHPALRGPRPGPDDLPPAA